MRLIEIIIYTMAPSDIDMSNVDLYHACWLRVQLEDRLCASAVARPGFISWIRYHLIKRFIRLVSIASDAVLTTNLYRSNRWKLKNNFFVEEQY